MDDSKPIALWARIAAGLIVGLIATELVGTSWSYWQHRVPPDSPWYLWVFLAYSACLMICTGLQVYFMPLKTELAYLAKAKARHGIPADQPRPKDKILKFGFYRIP